MSDRERLKLLMVQSAYRAERNDLPRVLTRPRHHFYTRAERRKHEAQRKAAKPVDCSAMTLGSDDSVSFNWSGGLEPKGYAVSELDFATGRWTDGREVSKAEYVAAERKAGFYNYSAATKALRQTEPGTMYFRRVVNGPDPWGMAGEIDLGIDD